jgi:sugar phosphate permease
MKTEASRRSGSIFLICYIAYTCIYIARLNLSMAAPGLKDLAVLSTEQIGVLGSVFSVVYACGRLFSGFLSDRQAPWKMISTGLVL